MNLIRDQLYADYCDFVAHTEANMQLMMGTFETAYTALELTI